MKKINCILILFIALSSSKIYAQIQGQIVDQNGSAISYVNIFIPSQSKGTTSNESGYFFLDYQQTNKEAEVVFQFIGYETVKKEILFDGKPAHFKIEMREKSIELSTVTIEGTRNPGLEIILKVIKKKKEILEKTNRYSVDFYSKCLVRTKDLPDKILGQSLAGLSKGLDSTGSGIIYLSETSSEVKYDRPHLVEKITASKISGIEQGFSFNNASDVNYNFYHNTIEFQKQIISPLADYGPQYYDYEYSGEFIENENKIHIIDVIPKKGRHQTFQGQLYIIDSIWNIYALNMKIDGENSGILGIDSLSIEQQFFEDEASKLWLLFSQKFKFNYNIFGFKGEGTFTAVYRNYLLQSVSVSSPNEILSYEENSNKRDSLYWEKNRPFVLTEEEINDYEVKDSIAKVESSKSYLDSLDRESNKLDVMDFLFEYELRNRYKRKSWIVKGPFLPNFNVLQGFNFKTGLGFTTWNDSTDYRFITFGGVNYGLADHIWRPYFRTSIYFDPLKHRYLSLSIGNSVKEVNNTIPIPEFLVGIFVPFFERNYMRYYEDKEISLEYNQEVINGLRAGLKLSYQNRKGLSNKTDFAFFDWENREYYPNSPVQQRDKFIFINEHQIFKYNLNLRLHFNQKYISLPHKKINLYSNEYPIVNIDFSGGIGIDDKENNYRKLSANAHQQISVGNKGEVTYVIEGGLFFGSNSFSYLDYQHFKGDEIGFEVKGDRNNQLKLLPYYKYSTQDHYAEFHLQYDFKGYIMEKIPLLNLLRSNLVVNFNAVIFENNAPYTEYSIGLSNLGWKKFRFLRIDYAWTPEKLNRSRGFVYVLTYDL